MYEQQGMCIKKFESVIQIYTKRMHSARAFMHQHLFYQCKSVCCAQQRNCSCSEEQDNAWNFHCTVGSLLQPTALSPIRDWDCRREIIYWNHLRWDGCLFTACSLLQFVPLCIHLLHRVFKRLSAERRWKLSKLSCMTWLRVPHSPLCNQHRCPHLILCEEHPPHLCHTTISRFWTTGEETVLWWWTVGVVICTGSHLHKNRFNNSIHHSSEVTAWVYLSDPPRENHTFISALMKAALYTDWLIMWCFQPVIKSVLWMIKDPKSDQASFKNVEIYL